MFDLREQLSRSVSPAYTLERELGGGGMSRVFVANEVALGRRVVVKVLAPELGADVSGERFRREVQLAARLQHPHIVPVLTAGEADGLAYYTMPLVEGESVRELLAREGPLPVGQAVAILRDVARALAYAHAHGVVHRDIKPENVLLSGGSATVTDFGIAKAVSASRTGAHTASLTLIGTSLGTPAYMAPEQAAGDPETDHRADLYAFGVVAWELLAGRPPFDGRTPAQLLAAQVAEPPPPIDTARAGVPASLSALVMRCLEKDPAARPQHAGDVLTALDALALPRGSVAIPVAKKPAPLPLWRPLAAYAAAFLAITTLAWLALDALDVPDWALPATLVVMALGLPLVLLTWFANRAAALPTRDGAPRRSAVVTLAARVGPHLSWQRAAVGGAVSLGVLVAAIGGFMALRAMGVGPVGSLLAGGRIADSDRIVVADFGVSGADSALSTVVGEAVRVQLGQSPLVRILSPAAVADALQRMRRPRGARLDDSLARELALREGVAAVVSGELVPVGEGWIVSMRLVAPDSSTELASYRATARSAEELLPTIDHLARRLRGRMGESLRKVRADPPLEQVTTSSLEALRRYALGVRAADREVDYARAETLLEEAIALDTAFAMAHRKLAVVLSNARVSAQTTRARQDSLAERAWRHRDRLTEREQAYATAAWYSFGPGRDRARAAKAYERLLERYPRDFMAINNLGVIAESRREWGRAEALFRRAISIEPGNTLSHRNLVLNLYSQGRFAAADSALAASRARFAGATVLVLLDLTGLAKRAMYDSLDARVAAVVDATVPRHRVVSRLSRAQSLATRGRLRESVRWFAEMRAEEARVAPPVSPLLDTLQLAWYDAVVRERPAEVARRLDAALAATPIATLPADEQPWFEAAELFALVGQPARARGLLAAYETTVRDTARRRWNEPLRARAVGAIALAEGRPSDALASFRAADRRPDGPIDECDACIQPLLAQAFHAAGQRDSAIRAWERFLAAAWWARNDPAVDPRYRAAAFKRLGELHEERGDVPRAIARYRDFVTLWERADPELQPVVADVRARLRRLSPADAR